MLLPLAPAPPAPLLVLPPPPPPAQKAHHPSAPHPANFVHRLLVMLTVYVVNYEGVIALGLKRFKRTVHSSSHNYGVNYVNDIVMECQL